MLIMLEAIWPSLRHYPNALPASAGVTSNRMIAYFVFWLCMCWSTKYRYSLIWLVQLPLVLIHPRKMRWLFFVKSMVAIIAAFAMLGWAVKRAGGSGPVFGRATTVHGATKSWAWVSGINIAISGKTTLAMNMVRTFRHQISSS